MKHTNGWSPMCKLFRDSTVYPTWTTQVCQHYAHTFGKFKFHYESDPTFDRLAQFPKTHVATLKIVKIARFKKRQFSKFFFSFFSLDEQISKTR